MLINKFVVDHFKVLSRVEHMSEGMAIEQKIKKDIEVERKVLTQLLKICAMSLHNKNHNIEEELGAEIFDMYDFRIVAEPKKQELIFGGNNAD